MAKLRINGDSSGYVDLSAPNAASSSTIDLDQVPQKNVANTFTTGQNITVPGNGGLTIQAGTNGSASLRLKNDATDWDVNCQTTDNFAIYNHTTGGNRLGITPAGIVTTPNQPCFQALGTPSANSGSYLQYGNLASGALPINVGGHYAPSTGKFTAPVAGVYQFNFGSIAQIDGKVHRYYPRKNQSNLYTGTGGQLHHRIDTTGGGYGTNSTFTFYANLAVSDYIQIYYIIDGGGSAHTSTIEYFTFSGQLVQ